MIFSGVLDLPWWGLVLVALGLTHITIASVTIFLHRHQAHRALDLHAIPSHFFRFWLWLTTGMVTKEWAAIHRKHHAKCETAEDPHSPQVLGIHRVLWGGVFLYVKESHNPDTMVRYGHGTPDDWLEKNIYSRYQVLGLTTMGVINVMLFGIVPGLIILVIQIVWIPFWAAGVINGLGHFFGYRNFDAADASTNLLPWGIFIGGEELHNNHHSHATSAKLSAKWYEFDIGWLYIRVLESLGLATVKKVAPTPRFALAKPVAALDAETLNAVIANRYDVLARYTRSLKRTLADEIVRLRQRSPNEAARLQAARPTLVASHALTPSEQAQLIETVRSSAAVTTVLSMRADLAGLWERSSASRDELVLRLKDWCSRAEASGIAPLAEFSQRLRCYA